jgi:hypothetical protein
VKFGHLAAIALALLPLVADAQTKISSAVDVDPRELTQESPYDDEFTTTPLDAKWQRVRLSSDRWRIDDKGFLVLKTARGDIAAWSNVAPLFLQKAPTGDWNVETRVCAAPKENFQQAGLVVTGKGTDHVRITVIHIAGNVQIECIRQTSGGRQTRQLKPARSDCYELRISRSDRTYRGYYRLPGQEWRLVSEFTGIELNDPSFGLTGFNGGSDSQQPMEASFDYFHVR